MKLASKKLQSWGRGLRSTVIVQSLHESNPPEDCPGSQGKSRIQMSRLGVDLPKPAFQISTLVCSMHLVSCNHPHSKSGILNAGYEVYVLAAI